MKTGKIISDFMKIAGPGVIGAVIIAVPVVGSAIVSGLTVVLKNWSSYYEIV